MDTRQFHKRCFALLLACALALGCLPRAQAASRSAIESLQSQQASLTVQKAELQKKLDGIRSSQGQALNKKNLVEQQLNVLKQQIQVSENLLAQYARQITEKEAELEQAKAKEAEYQAEFEQRVRAMEERGNVSYWSVLFQASDFSDLLDRIDMIGEIMDADDQVLDQLAEARQAVVQAKADLEASRQGQQETLAQQQSQQAQLQAQQAEVDQLIQEIATQGDVYDKQIEKLEATQDDVAQQIAEAEAIYQKQLAAEKAAAEKAAAEKAAAEKAAAEQAAKAAQAAAQKAAQQQKQQSSGSSASGSSSSSGSQSSQTTASASGFLWPIASSHRVTSPFGWRTHPITRAAASPRGHRHCRAQRHADHGLEGRGGGDLAVWFVLRKLCGDLPPGRHPDAVRPHVPAKRLSRRHRAPGADRGFGRLHRQLHRQPPAF